MPQLKVLVLLFGFWIHLSLCNTITETSSDWSKKIICDEDENCWDCDCHLSCTGTNACDTIKLFADRVTSLSIDCVQPSGSGSLDTTCYNMHINATGNVLFPSSSSVDINCNSESSYTHYNPCGYSTFALINFGSISVHCETENSCQGVTLMSYKNNKVDVNCNDQSSCNFATMYINNSETVSINIPTDTMSALKSSKIYINGVTDELSEINCNGKQTCADADFTFRNIETYYYYNGLSMNCLYDESWSSYQGSCANVNIYLDSSYTFVYV
eukprot:329589_1